MAEIKITSNDQKGGITAHSVSGDPGSSEVPKKGRAFGLVVGIATIVGTLIAAGALWLALRQQ